jgi:hypothetical protein
LCLCILSCPGAGGPGEVAQAAGGGVPVHPRAATVKQDGSADTRAGRLVDGPADRWRQRDQDDSGALAADAQHPVAVFFAEVGDVCAGGFGDPEPEQAEHGGRGEVVPVG